jgi:hypothetical protein
MNRLFNRLAGRRESSLAGINAFVLLLALNRVRIMDENPENKLVIVEPGTVNELVQLPGGNDQSIGRLVREGAGVEC